ncbi:MAG: hypothetical protein H6Q63_194 [Firmicutes bacterium]|nr:hypothetical protein [Bacillota bacterium]
MRQLIVKKGCLNKISSELERKKLMEETTANCDRILIPKGLQIWFIMVSKGG